MLPPPPGHQKPGDIMLPAELRHILTRFKLTQHLKLELTRKPSPTLSHNISLIVHCALTTCPPQGVQSTPNFNIYIIRFFEYWMLYKHNLSFHILSKD